MDSVPRLEMHGDLCLHAVVFNDAIGNLHVRLMLALLLLCMFGLLSISYRYEWKM